MKKFIVLYYTPDSVVKEMHNISPEEMKKRMEQAMEPWMVWVKKCGDRLLDMGSPLGGGIHISKNGNQPSKREVSGYSILQANSMEEAIKLLENHPQLESVHGYRN